jgi:uncharacterized protein
MEPGYEPLVAQEDTPLALVTMVEDELILALPIVPMHPENLCPTVLAPGTVADSDLDTKEHPFAVLSNLKRRLKS